MQCKLHTREIPAMKKKPIIRVAHVRFTPYGTSYAMRCLREDINVGNIVEVLMYAEEPRAYYYQGTVEKISYERWNCRCHVVNLASEVQYDLADNGFIRTTKSEYGNVFQL